MWPLIQLYIRRSPQVLLPFAMVFGYLGYTIEGWLSNKYTPPTVPVKEQRDERFLERVNELTAEAPDKPKHNPLEVNLSPSLT